MNKKRKIGRKNVKSRVVIIIIALLCIFVLKQKCIANKQMEMKEVIVTSNDTIWNLAQNVCEKNNKLNIQNVIIDIKKINKLENSKIYVGQTIYIPQY